MLIHRADHWCASVDHIEIARGSNAHVDDAATAIFVVMTEFATGYSALPYLNDEIFPEPCPAARQAASTTIVRPLARGGTLHRVGVCTENAIHVDDVTESPKLADDRAVMFWFAVLASPFKSKIRLEAENAVLRHQLIVLRRKLRGAGETSREAIGGLVGPAAMVIEEAIRLIWGTRDYVLQVGLH